PKAPAPGARRAGRVEFFECRMRFRQWSRSTTPVRHRGGSATKPRLGRAISSKFPRSHWCRGESKLRPRMDPSVVSDHRLKVDIGAISLRNARIKGCGRFATSFTHFIGLEGALDDIRDRTILAAGES